MNELLECIKSYLNKNGIADRKILLDHFAYIYPALLESVKTETDTEVLLVGIEAIHECISVIEDNALPQDVLKNSILLVHDLILATRSRREKLMKSNPDGDIDDSLIIRDELEKEDDINNEIAEVMGVLVKYHRSNFLNIFQATDLAKMIIEMSHHSKPVSERQLSLCVFDDFVEYLHDQSYPYFTHFLPLMIEYTLDPFPAVRQAAAYGLGICAQYGGVVIKPYMPQILDILLKAINEPNARTEEMIPPTENAIASIGRIIQYQSDFLGDKLPQLTDFWVNSLPIEVDTVEAKQVHQQLCHFIKHINTAVFGPNGKNLPKILDIFGKIVDTDLVTPETQNIIKDILSSMYKQLAPEIFQRALHSISQESQNKLRNLK